MIPAQSSQPLGLLPTVSLSREQLEMLQSIEKADLWFVQERLERKLGLRPDQAERSIFEFKRYMALVGLGYRGLGMVSPAVDEAWHAFILFTREYAAFCHKAFGQFIHHIPRTSRDNRPDEGGTRFAEAYAEVFGPLATVWREAFKMQTADDGPSGCGSEDCTSN
ncbi:MAG TPA: hypothetical protein VFI11_13065 [Anaerolineales bacterium]|nr:hypothetical protein [Anaerolineales bacterium]